MGIVGVGWGKSLASFLLPVVMGCSNPLIVVRSSLVDNLRREVRKWMFHYAIPSFSILSYEDMSSRKKIAALRALAPDLVVFDEAHRLKGLDSARWLNFLEYLRDFPATRVVVMSGTVTTQTTDDYAHLFQAALRDGSPVPYPGTLPAAAWRRGLGAVPDPEDCDYAQLKPLIAQYPNDTGSFYEQGREALRRHLEGTAGVVISHESSCRASIVMEWVREPAPPRSLEDLALSVVADRRDPDGEPVTLQEADTIASQLQFGFWYRKLWGTTPRDVVDRWRMSVSLWNRIVSAYLKAPLPGLTSPAGFAEAVRSGAFPDCSGALAAVDDVRHWYERETVWVWRGWVEAQVDWVRNQREPGILWYASSTALDPEWAEQGVVFHSKKPRIDVDRPASMACCLWSVREGHNLQAWGRARYAQPPRDPGVWQQSMGRIHRPGQERDEVNFEVCAHTKALRAKVKRAIDGCRYVEETTGERQRLLLASWSG